MQSSKLQLLSFLGRKAFENLLVKAFLAVTYFVSVGALEHVTTFLAVLSYTSEWKAWFSFLLQIVHLTPSAFQVFASPFPFSYLGFLFLGSENSVNERFDLKAASSLVTSPCKMVNTY